MAHIRIHPLVAGLLVVLGTGLTQADPVATSNGPLEEIVITASRFEQRLFDSPASLSVIDELELSHSTAYALADLLRDVPGVQ